MNQGKFITLYGINNIGKSTQAHLLVEHLKRIGHKVVFLKYPLYDLAPTGQILNEILRGNKTQELTEEELQTLFMQNRLDFEPQLKHFLAEGTTVVAEDYTGTGIAWGLAKGLDQAWLEQKNQHLVREDLAILLRGKRFLQAKEKGHLHEENDQLIEKVDAILMQLAKKYAWQVVDAEGSVEQVAARIFTVVEKWMG